VDKIRVPLVLLPIRNDRRTLLEKSTENSEGAEACRAIAMICKWQILMKKSATADFCVVSAHDAGPDLAR
jgi:hypothetical protein